jgi:phospholipid/cholesterol/gamma-HCH transport system substrate-binding protein
MGNTIKVGFFMTVALIVLGYLILKAEDIQLFTPKGERIEAEFANVAGLDDKSTVRMAGVRVGRVDGIRLDNNLAVVTLLMEQDLVLTLGTRASIANLGMLGDKYVELLPGPPGARILGEGDRIPGQAPASLDEVLGSLGDLGKDLQKVTGQLTGTDGPEGPIGRLVANLEATSVQLREILEGNRWSIDTTMANFATASATLATELPKVSAQLEGLLAEVRSVVGENRDRLHGSLENIETLTANLQKGVDSLNIVTERLANGEGTIGKLLTSDEAHDSLVATMESVRGGVDNLSDTLGRVQKLELELAMEGYVLNGTDENLASFNLGLGTSSGHHYRFAVVDGPTPVEKRQVETITVTDSDGNQTTETIETLEVKDELTFSALLGVPLAGDFRAWTGLIETTFGVEVEYTPHPRWIFSFEAFDFDRSDDLEPHLRFTTGWRVTDKFYVLGGYDDFLTDDLGSVFLGGGIRWSDDDLKYLMGSLPSF